MLGGCAGGLLKYSVLAVFVADFDEGDVESRGSASHILSDPFQMAP
jgi:hypothetical protein